MFLKDTSHFLRPNKLKDLERNIPEALDTEPTAVLNSFTVSSSVAVLNSLAVSSSSCSCCRGTVAAFVSGCFVTAVPLLKLVSFINTF